MTAPNKGPHRSTSERGEAILAARPPKATWWVRLKCGHDSWLTDPQYARHMPARCRACEAERADARPKLNKRRSAQPEQPSP